MQQAAEEFRRRKVRKSGGASSNGVGIQCVIINRVKTRKPLEIGKKSQLLTTELVELVEPKTITNTFIL